MICKIRVRNFNPIQFQIQATCPVVLQLAVLMLHFICSHLWFTSRKRLDGGNPTIAILIYCRCVTDTYKIYLDNWGAPAIPKGWSTFFNLQAAHNMRKFILPQPSGATSGATSGAAAAGESPELGLSTSTVGSSMIDLSSTSMEPGYM